MAIMGRPRKEIDYDQLEKLCQLQCTLLEIAYFFGCSDDTIENRVKERFDMTFSEYYKKYSAHGKISLRRFQFEAAKKGNTSMLIWLGKQHLEQREPKSEQLIEIRDEDNIAREYAAQLKNLGVNLQDERHANEISDTTE